MKRKSANKGSPDKELQAHLASWGLHRGEALVCLKMDISLGTLAKVCCVKPGLGF